MKHILPIFLLLAIGSTVTAQSYYYVRQDPANGLYYLSLYDVQTCQNTDVVPIDLSDFNNPIILDLAVTPAGDFYFLTSNYDPITQQITAPNLLLKYDVALDTITIATTLPYFCNSLVADGNGVLFAAGDGLYVYNSINHIGQDKGLLNFVPSGDLAFIEGELFCASYGQNNLMQVNIDVPWLSTVFMYLAGLPTFESVWGLVAIPESCDSTTVFMASAQQIGLGPSTIYQLDIEDHSIIYFCTSQEQITGFTSPNEFNLFNCVIHLNLDSDASSGAPYTDWQAPLLCSPNSLPVTDTDASYYSSLHTDSICIRLIGTVPDAPFEYLNAMVSGSISATGQGSTKIKLTGALGTSINVSNNDYQTVLRTVRWYDAILPPSPGVRTVEVIAYDSGGYRDTAYAYLPVYSTLSAGADTVYTVCEDAQAITLHAPGSASGGAWSPMLPGGVFSPQSDPSGTFAYTVGGGVCPMDTAIVTVNVLPMPTFTLGQDTTVCSNHFPLQLTSTGLVRWQDGSSANTFTATQPGTYWAEQTNMAGCSFRDSISITASAVFSSIEYAQSCHGQPYIWNGQIFTRDTVVCTNFLALNGCDSTPCLQLTYYYPSLVLDTSICDNQTVTWLGHDFDLPGIYTDTLLLNGCMTATVLFLNTKPLDTIAQNVAICNGEVYNAWGQTFSNTGEYFIPLQHPMDCDSIVRLHLTVRPPAESVQTVSVCPGSSYVFDGNTITNPGTYTAHYSAPATGCDSTATLILSLFPGPAPQITGDTVFCNGGGGNLSTGVYANYQWSNGATTAALQNVSAGTYTVTVTSLNGCSAIATTQLKELPPLAPEWVTGNPRCHGESSGSVALTGMAGGVEPLFFSLNGGPPTTNQTFAGLLPGQWTLLTTDAEGCSSTFSFLLTDPPELSVELGPDRLLQYGDLYPIPVEINLPGEFEYDWSPASGLDCSDCPNPVATAQEEVTYTLVLTDPDGCEASDRLTLNIKIGEGQVYIPNIITPNDDGFNDALTVYGSFKLVAAVELFRVYDRWGELLFESKSLGLNDESTGWNGEQRGRPVLPGIFVWYAEIRLNDGSLLQKSGDVTVFR